jgi:hypothetical protein
MSVCCSPDGDLNGIVIDSGATRHMCGELSYFFDLIDIPPKSWPINGIGGKILHAIGVGTIKGEGLYKVKATVSRHAAKGLIADTGPVTLNVWHKRLGHVNHQTVRRMANGIGTIGMKISPGSETMDECCHGCEVGKMHKLPFSNSTTKYSSVGECVVSDLVGPMQVNSVGGAR